MVDPSPPMAISNEKSALRRQYRAARAEHVAALPATLRALILNRPPAVVAAMLPKGKVIGLYAAMGDEAPTFGWARWLSENDRQVALPWFESRNAPMEFRLWANPFNDDQLAPGPWGALQPVPDSDPATPDVIIAPVVAFTATGHRLGQGGGHYDQWLAAHPEVPAMGLAWDCQLAESLPIESHDRRLGAVVTPTRIYEAGD